MRVFFQSNLYLVAGLCVLILTTFGTQERLSAQTNPRGVFEFVSRVDASQDDAVAMVLDGKMLYVANKTAGLTIFEIMESARLKKISRTPSVGQNYGIAKKDNFVFLADNLAGLLVYDVTNPKKPILINEVAVPGEVRDLQIKGNYAYLAAGLSGLVVMDITDPKAPQQAAKLRYDRDWDFTSRLKIVGDRLFLADRKSGIHVISIADPLAPRELKKYQTSFAVGVDVAGDYVYVADGPGGLVILDATNIEKMKQVATVNLPGHANSVYKSGPYVYVSLDDAGIRAIDVSDPKRPIFDSRFDTPGQVYGVVKYDIFMIVADVTSILTLIHNKPPVIYPLQDMTVAENQQIQFKIRGYDPDDNPISFSANFLPEGAVFNEKDTTVTWTPSFEQSGKYEGLILVATEKTQSKLFSRDTVTITVTNTNRAPALPITGNYVVDENKPLAFKINRPSDPDVEDEGKLKVSLLNPPTGSTFNGDSLSFSWIPTYEQSGSYTLNFEVRDAGGLTDVKQTTLTVNHVNRPPIFADLKPSFTGDENKEIRFAISATDLDKEDAGKLDYAAFDLPPGAAFDKTSQTITWTPTYEQSGSYAGLYFIVRDPDGLSDTVSTAITVNHVNRPPFISSITAQKIDEVKQLVFKVNAADPDIEDDGKVVLKAKSVPEGALFDETTRTLTWTPTYEQSGEYTVTFTATDGAGATDELSVPITVMNINRPPTIAVVEPQISDEAKEFTLVVPEGQDPDKEDIGKLTYTAEKLPQGASFDPATRTIKWTPTYDQSGVYDGIKVTVKDLLGLTATTTFKITVNHVNRQPVLEEVVAQTVDETKAMQVRIKGSDPDKEDAGKLVLTAADLPQGATAQQFENTLLVNWTPTFDQSGVYTVKVKVADPSGLSDTKDLVITVNNVNRLPKLETIAAVTGEENKAITITIPEAVDPDKEDAGKLKYTAEGLPQGATFDPVAKTITWTPTYDQSGSYSIKVSVTDLLQGTDSKTVTVNVKHVNRPPVMSDIAAKSGEEGQKFEMTVEVSDPDKEDAGKLTLTAQGLPQGAVFNAGAKTLTWTPTYEQAGEYNVTFKVTDPSGLGDTKSAAISIKNVNRKPAIGQIITQKIAENSNLAFVLTGTDPDKEDAGKLTFSADGLPSGATFSADGKFNWTPTYDQAGDYNVNLHLKDPGGMEDTKTQSITVTNVNRAPVLNSLSGASGKEGGSISFQASANDPDKNDKLTFTMTGAPTGASLSGDGSFSWTPQVGQAGSYTVTIKVTDGSLSDSKSCTITVEKAAQE